MYNFFASQNCHWAAQWVWTMGTPPSGADLISNWCIQNARGDQSRAFSEAQKYSEALQHISGVERAWAQPSGVVCVVLQGEALLQLALNDYINPWKDPTPERWLLDYGAMVPFEEVAPGHLREGVLGDCLARTLEYAGHRVVRQRLVSSDGAQVKELGAALQRAMQSIELDSKADIGSSQKPSLSVELMKRLAEQALRMGVQSHNLEGIEHFACSTMMALQEEVLASARVEFGNIVLTEQLRDEVENVLSEWKAAGHVQFQEGAIVFNGPAFGGERELVVVKANGQATYLTECVSQHVEQLRTGFEHIVHVRSSSHSDIEKSVRLGLEGLQLRNASLRYLLVEPTYHDFRGMRHRRMPALAADMLKQMGTNGMRLGMLSTSPNRALRCDQMNWREQVTHLGQSMHNALVQAHLVVEKHCQHVANMQAGPIAHVAKPLIFALLRWPQCHQMAIETLNPALVYKHATELVQLIHKTHANVPMQELDGPSLEAMGTAWTLASAQLRTLMELMGLDLLEWEDAKAKRHHNGKS